MLTLISKILTVKKPLMFWIDIILFCGVIFSLLIWSEVRAEKTVQNVGTVSISIRQFSDNAQLDIDPQEQIVTDNGTADYLLQFNYVNRDNDLETVRFEEIE